MASEIGLSSQEIQEVLWIGQLAGEVHRDETEAGANNISAVPFFVINGKYAVPGALPVLHSDRYGRSIVSCGHLLEIRLLFMPRHKI